jgi:hypothetical protein
MSVLTVLEATVEPGREVDLTRAFRETAGQPIPAFILSSRLVRAASDPTTWRIMTEFASMAELEAMRATAETPRGVVMFNEAGAQPTLAVYEIVDEFSNPAP